MEVKIKGLNVWHDRVFLWVQTYQKNILYKRKREREREREIEIERKRLMGSASMCKTGREKERRERERVIDVSYCIGKQLPRCLRASSCYRQLHWGPHVHVSWSHSPAKLAGTVTVCVRERESHTWCQW